MWSNDSLVRNVNFELRPDSESSWARFEDKAIYTPKNLTLWNFPFIYVNNPFAGEYQGVLSSDHPPKFKCTNFLGFKFGTKVSLLQISVYDTICREGFSCFTFIDVVRHGPVPVQDKNGIEQCWGPRLTPINGQLVRGAGVRQVRSLT